LSLASAHHRAELGYWIGVSHWNQGIATEASFALIDFTFSTMDINRIEAYHLTRNPASGRVMQKVGMTHEGTLREHLFKNGVFEDSEIFSLLKSEWGRDASGKLSR
jgi:ribosomal-protein-alanine N-acetyltransferase